MKKFSYKNILSLVVALSVLMSTGTCVFADEVEDITIEDVVIEENVDESVDESSEDVTEESTDELIDETELSEPDVVVEEVEPAEEIQEIEEVIDEEESYNDLLVASGYTRQNAVSWANSKVGIVIDNYPSYSGADITGPYMTALDPTLGDEGEYSLRNTSSWMPVDWTRVYNFYQPGDIAVWKYNLAVISGFSTIETDDYYGHVGIIVSCDETGFYAVEYYRQSGTTSARVVKNWHYYSELYCAVRPDFPGSLQAGWRVENNVRCYYNGNGTRLYGLQKIDGYYYYLQSDGIFTGGWKTINGSWYYFQSSGQAYANTTRTIGGKSYTFNSYGVCTNRVSTVEMYRLYNRNSGEHFYTSDAGERNMLISVGWTYEGVGWVAPSTSNTPVYRLYNPYGGEHHYTTSISERNNLIAAGWNDEGIGWYSDDDCTIPLYRQYNPNAFANNHNYTTSRSENNYLISIGWRGEGVAWYGVGN